jgi:hypothetical protein
LNESSKPHRTRAISCSTSSWVREPPWWQPKIWGAGSLGRTST